MQLAMVGLGRMGGNVVRRQMAAGHTCVVYDRDAAAIARLTDEGGIVAPILATWQGAGDKNLAPYAADSQGPDAADTLLKRDRRRWRAIQ